MRPEALRGRRPPARDSARSCCEVASRSFGRRSSIWTHRGVRTAAEPCDARSGALPGRGLEMAPLNAPDGLHDDGAAAVEVLGRQQLLAVLLQARGAPDAEDDLAHVAPDPFLRVPKRQEPRLESKRFAFLVDTVLAGEVIERQLDVVQLRSEIRL